MSAEECRNAFLASLDLIREKCGACGRAVMLEEVSVAVGVPLEVEKIISEKNPALTREQRISAIAESEWALGWAKGMVNLVSPGLTGKEREEAISRLSRTLAEKVV